MPGHNAPSSDAGSYKNSVLIAGVIAVSLPVSLPASPIRQLYSSLVHSNSFLLHKVAEQDVDFESNCKLLFNIMVFTPESLPDLGGRVYLVTGGNSGM
jgi:hypothetical protein